MLLNSEIDLQCVRVLKGIAVCVLDACWIEISPCWISSVLFDLFSCLACDALCGLFALQQGLDAARCGERIFTASGLGFAGTRDAASMASLR